MSAVRTTFFISSRTFQVSKTRSKRPRPLSEDEMLSGCRLGLDSHADVHCVGRHARILEIFEGRSCNVQPFNDSYQPMQNIMTANAAFAYDTDDGQTFILEVNQALDFTDSMEHSLLCVNQTRIHGVVVDDIPPLLDLQNRSTHSVHFPLEDIRMPLSLHGPVSYLPVRHPTDQELNECIHLELSAGDTPWDPMSIQHLYSANSVHTSPVPMSSNELSLLHANLLDDICQHVVVNAVQQTPRTKKY